MQAYIHSVARGIKYNIDSESLSGSVGIIGRHMKYSVCGKVSVSMVIRLCEVREYNMRV